MLRRLLYLALYPIALAIRLILHILDPHGLSDTKPTSHRRKPLDERELSILAQRLDSPLTHPSVTDLYGLEGFFVCLAIGPEPILPTHWLDVIFRGRVPVADKDELAELLNLLTRFHNQIVDACMTGMTYRPQWTLSPEASKQAWTSWCRGFMAATCLRQAQWDTLLDRNDPSSPLYLIWRRAAGDDVDLPKIQFGLPQCQKSINRIRRYWVIDQ